MRRLALAVMLASKVALAQGAMTVPEEENWSQEDSPNYKDYSVIEESLPALKARWQKRERVSYRGVVPVALNAAAGKLHITFVAPIEPGYDYPGALESFLIFEKSESPPWGNTYGALWHDRKTGRSIGPIHAAIRVRPSNDLPRVERRQVVVYNPPDRPDILLVATKSFVDEEWTPLLRVDMPKATRFDLIQTGWH